MLKNNDWDIPKRDFRIEVFSGRGEGGDDSKIKKNVYLSKLSIDNKIRFNTSTSDGGGMTTLDITINGLTLNKMEELSTCCSNFANPMIYNRIEVYGGYGENSGLLFNGDIINATPDINSSNYSIALKASSYYTKMINVIKNYSFSGTRDVIYICQKFADDLGFVLYSGEGIEDVVVDNYYYANHSIFDNIRYLAGLTGLNIYAEYNMLIVKQKSKPIKSHKEFNINSRNLIGTIRPTDNGCDCDILLNPSIRLGTLVKLDNRTFPRLNDGKYIITSYSHNGDTKGSSWKTTLKLIKEELYGK